jgi:hypothetical protein
MVHTANVARIVTLGEPTILVVGDASHTTFSPPGEILGGLFRSGGISASPRRGIPCIAPIR